ncbi:MAG TPA: SPOR domain-containing protein [Gemmatimonadales bacterium]
MTLRPLPRSRLEQLVPSLVHGQALVALVPVTGERRWAAQAAWDVARAAAREGRRVALVDLWVEEPLLHEVAGIDPSDGIVDAFEFGVSLNKAAHEVNGVFFIPAGSYTTSAADVFANPRWRKLQAGFRSEDALLLVYLSPEALGRLSAVPDGVMALAPQGLETDSTAGRALAAAGERGAPFLGVVRERSLAPVPPVRKAERGPERVGRRRRSLATALGLATVAAGTWVLFARSAERPPESAPVAPPPPTVAQRDTVFWTVQLAAYGTLAGAVSQADALLAENIRALVAPIVQGGSTSVWYRVLAAGFPSRDSAVAGRAAFWARGVAPDGQGDLLRAPYSLTLDSAVALDSLRGLGVPVTRWSNGRVLLGGFETPEQAAYAEALVARAGARARLVTRTEPRP